MTTKRNYMACDQYGNWFHNLGQHPRKALLAILGKAKASKMFQDTKDGKTMHVGYVIGGHWLTLFEVRPFGRPRNGQFVTGLPTTRTDQ